ncbi:hypothetical protein GALMADRAFT_148121 [Galerina marginata CBS 339.88]|uniref:Uncharacterized protein n=1 Tax=Galerina marginata (strain CBS 339.88) TaxID=685588 RepID=A0A067S5V8_GALM3|nr:hypothetical protein GALMADRAFT_148121 [Galerina marginata CBS 339.88]
MTHFAPFLAKKHRLASTHEAPCPPLSPKSTTPSSNTSNARSRNASKLIPPPRMDPPRTRRKTVWEHPRRGVLSQRLVGAVCWTGGGRARRARGELSVCGVCEASGAECDFDGERGGLGLRDLLLTPAFPRIP